MSNHLGVSGVLHRPGTSRSCADWTSRTEVRGLNLRIMSFTTTLWAMGDRPPLSGSAEKILWTVINTEQGTGSALRS